MSEVVETAGISELPSSLALNHAVKLAIKDDRPIMLDYWEESHNQVVFFGIKANGEKLLVKNEEEYTSPISKIFKVDKEYLVLTENSLYMVSSNCSTKKIT